VPLFQGGTAGDWTVASPKNTVGPHPSLRATLSHKERGDNKWGCAQIDVSCHAVATVSQETSVCSLEVSARMCGSFPRPRGEGGPPSGGPGEGQPRELVLKMAKSLLFPREDYRGVRVLALKGGTFDASHFEWHPTMSALSGSQIKPPA